MKKVIVAALATVLTLATTAAFAQASGAMSSSEMASGTMAKEPMSKDTMKKGKTKHDKMKKGSDATGTKPEASGTMGQ
jgi:pentapeptide MXKDX repeat protein